MRWQPIADLEDAAPLGKVAAALLVLGAPRTEVVLPLGGALPAGGARQRDHAQIHLEDDHRYCTDEAAADRFDASCMDHVSCIPSHSSVAMPRAVTLLSTTSR